MSAPRTLLLRALALLALLCAGAAPARADTAIALWKAFDGRVNFTGTQVSLRTRSNTDNACAVSSSNTNRTAALALPIGATVLSAQLYWAGSGTTDSVVTFEGKSVTATRKYTSATVGDGFNYFGGAADVTSVVKAKGSGTYNFSGLTISTGSPWCAAQGVLGGFSLLVVYAHPTEPERVLNLYEGFRHVQNGEVVVNASNFRWNRTAWPVRERARIGHITWEGDPTLAADGESLLYEGEEVSDSLNPEGNQFNSRSNINRDSASYGIDFDAYDTTVLIWNERDARVTTRYRTGQDMVILAAEVLVVPTMPVSDLSIAIARGNALFQVGKQTSYIVDVTNNGPYTEAGPITVTATLPDGLTYVSGTGTGWTCAAKNQAVTCTYKGAFAPDTKAAPLTITAAVKTTGQKTTTVSVKGTDDDNAANNTASNVGTAGAAEIPNPQTPVPSMTSYIFTRGACAAGIMIGDPRQPCQYYDASMVGGSRAEIYLTAMTDGAPAAASTSTDMTPSFQFALSCIAPETGVSRASYGATTPAALNIPPCAANGLSWSPAVQVSFPKGMVSVKQDFYYPDVGKVKLNLKESERIASTLEFIVRPLRIGFKRIRSADAANPRDNPGAATPQGAGFVPAGTWLNVEVGALLQDGVSFAPNFREQDTTGVRLDKATILNLDAGVLDEKDAATRVNTNGILTIQTAWSEVGAVNFVVALLPKEGDDESAHGRYLDQPVAGGTTPVGRFYPAYFTTTVTGRFACPARLPAGSVCPRQGEDGAVYARQPFDVTVQAFNANNQELKNFAGDWFRTVTLSAVNAAGDAPVSCLLSSTEIAGGLVPVSPSCALSVPFSNLSPRANNWTEPLAVFIRAESSEPAVPVTSRISSRRTGDEVTEDGVLVLNGRMRVANALGSAALPTPLPLRAEYWGGAGLGWLRDLNYGNDIEVDATPLQFGPCALKGVAGCDRNVIGAVAGRSIDMVQGRGVLWLRAAGKQANGASRSGSYDVQLAPGGPLPWLPSTTGRVSIGGNRNPVIYVREMYF